MWQLFLILGKLTTIIFVNMRSFSWFWPKVYRSAFPTDRCSLDFFCKQIKWSTLLENGKGERDTLCGGTMHKESFILAKQSHVDPHKAHYFTLACLVSDSRLRSWWFYIVSKHKLKVLIFWKQLNLKQT